MVIEGRSPVTTSPLFAAFTAFLVKVWSAFAVAHEHAADPGSKVVSVVCNGRVMRKSQAHVTCMMRA